MGKGETEKALGWVTSPWEEILVASGLVVGNVPESSSISRKGEHLVVCYPF